MLGVMPFGVAQSSGSAPAPFDPVGKLAYSIQITSPGQTFTLPFEVAGTYNATVGWGDGSSDDTITVWNDSNRTHTYAAVGTYNIQISGTCTHHRFNNAGDRLLVRELFNADLTGLSAVDFYGCTGLHTIDPACRFHNSQITSAFQSTFRNCTSLTSIPAGLFDNNTAVTTNAFTATFRDCTSLTAIPAGLFDNNTAVTTNAFNSTFQGCTSLTAIPSGLFANNTAVTTNAFTGTFRQCNLTSIPAGLFASNTAVTTSAFSLTFANCAVLTSIPAGLFDNNTAVTTIAFQGTFQGCAGLTSIPAGLFDNNTAVTTGAFGSTFAGCTGLTSIPAGLFDNNTAVTTSAFNSTFLGCTGLTSIPAGLFDNNTAVTTNAFASTFFGCTGLTSIPAGLFDNNTAVTTGAFASTFSGCSNTALTTFPADIFRFNVLARGFLNTWQNTRMTAATIDDWLVSLDTYNNPAGAKTLRYDALIGDGHLNANRSPAGAAARTSLIGKGYTISGTY